MWIVYENTKKPMLVTKHSWEPQEEEDGDHNESQGGGVYCFWKSFLETWQEPTYWIAILTHSNEKSKEYSQPVAHRETGRWVRVIMEFENDDHRYYYDTKHEQLTDVQGRMFVVPENDPPIPEFRWSFKFRRRQEQDQVQSPQVWEEVMQKFNIVLYEKAPADAQPTTRTKTAAIESSHSATTSTDDEVFVGEDDDDDRTYVFVCDQSTIATTAS